MIESVIKSSIYAGTFLPMMQLVMLRIFSFDQFV